MATKDKLNRYRTVTIAVATMRANVPFWVALTDTERRRWSGPEQRRFFLRTGNDRRQFRDFIRQQTPESLARLSQTLV